MTTTRYETHLRVSSYEVSATGEVRPAAYLNYMEEVATRASESIGFTYEWYVAHRGAWVVRKLILRHFHPAVVNDELILTTWISEARRVQAYREYDMRRADGQPILRARHTWAYLNADTLMPERLPAEFVGRYLPEGHAEPIELALSAPMPATNARTFVSERRVEYFDLDTNGHVNNAVYVQWVEQALVNALRAVGWPPDRWQTSDPGGQVVWQRIGRESEYFRALRDDEPIRIAVRMAETDADHVVWESEIQHGTTGDRIARDRTIWQVSDALKQALITPS
ncbi:MAG: acyl-[acyl-carrier-protein] thioesterase [Aggregatilineales bacterium]